MSNEIMGNQGPYVEPEFAATIQNVTVTAGREALLSCEVANLGEFGVSIYNF